MFFDTSIQAFDINIIPVEEESHLILQFICGVVIPGPGGQKGILPAGAVKVPIGKEMAVNKAKQMLEVAEALPDPPKESGLIIPESAAEVEQVAQVDEAIREGTIPVAAE